MGTSKVVIFNLFVSGIVKTYCPLILCRHSASNQAGTAHTLVKEKTFKVSFLCQRNQPNFLNEKTGHRRALLPQWNTSSWIYDGFLNKWKILAILYIEDTEDVYILGFLITGFLLFGVGGYLLYRHIQKTSAAIQVFMKLPVMCEGMSRAVNTQTTVLSELNCKLDGILEQNLSQLWFSNSLAGWIRTLRSCKLSRRKHKNWPQILLFGFRHRNETRDSEGRWKIISQSDPKQLLLSKFASCAGLGTLVI